MPMNNYKISASILTADFLRLGHEIDSLVGHVDELHLDVCDGHFVPSLSFGDDLVTQICARYADRCHVDAHLMVANPEQRAEPLVATGARSVVFHVEATLHPHTLLTTLQQHGIAVGLGVIPKTPETAIQPLIEFCQRVLVMTVNPGFGGQALILPMLKKVERMRKLAGDGIDIIVDGGVNLTTIRDAKNAGANIFVIGSALLNAAQRVEYIHALRDAL